MTATYFRHFLLLFGEIFATELPVFATNNRFLHVFIAYVPFFSRAVA
jgi:hypothetical protein